MVEITKDGRTYDLRRIFEAIEKLLSTPLGAMEMTENQKVTVRQLSRVGYDIEIAEFDYDKNGNVKGDHHWFVATTSSPEVDKAFKLAQLLALIWDITVGRPEKK